MNLAPAGVEAAEGEEGGGRGWVGRGREEEMGDVLAVEAASITSLKMVFLGTHPPSLVLCGLRLV